MNLKNRLVNFVQNCNSCFKEVQVNETNGIIKSDRFICSYDNMYLCITFLDTGSFK